jgi:pentatricopeptide repeat protein
MSIMTSSSFLSITVDFQAVFQRIGCDVVMFVTAILAYWVLYRAKTTVAPAKRFKLKECIVEEQSIVEEDEEEALVVNQPEDELEAASQIRQMHEERVASENLVIMQKYAASGNIKETLCKFRSVELSGQDLSSAMYNAVMQAWVKCGNVWAAENWMEETKQAGMADEKTFIILSKALFFVRDLDKARTLLNEMKEHGVTPSIAIFNELLRGFARAGLFRDGMVLLRDMGSAGLEPTAYTVDVIAMLLNTARDGCQRFADVQDILRMFKLGLRVHLAQLPCLAAVISRVDVTMASAATTCVHAVEIKGSLSRLKHLRKTLKKYGFLDKAENDARPLDGHWDTGNGLKVFIEGKMVRGPYPQVARLTFTSGDQSHCRLAIRGKTTQGHLVEARIPGSLKALSWDNGDIWHCYDGRTICHSTFFSQSMTKILRDRVQDMSYCARSVAVLRCVSKQGLHLPVTVEHKCTEYLGSNLHHLQVHFTSKTTRPEVLQELSCRHPRVGFRHCWVKPCLGSCGQRTIVNGEETDEASSNKHINAVCIA